jgi:hypothetical protein
MPDDLKTPWTSFPEMFGEDMGPPVFQDQPQEPGPHSTAAIMTRRRQRLEKEARRDRDLAQLASVAAEESLDRALDKALELIQRGRKVPDGVRGQAMAALNRRGGNLTSAELMAQRRLLAQGMSREP